MVPINQRRNLNRELPESINIAVGRFLVIDNLEERKHDRFHLSFCKKLKDVANTDLNKVELVNLTDVLGLCGQLVVKNDFSKFNVKEDLTNLEQINNNDYVHYFMKQNTINWAKFAEAHQIVR
ncbi:hypothetical protein WICANDRAFT_85836 [Wickerhamomyces anomalus NRRL Y-366-8]|uniref:Uncharacterized protein n=1 Tax=Wickerhamomyces anomalus (strain ATCC 58044 / CBS 1984 / NCYC 433 / NRRL Y-366-8) TaxID=683960 RepID=A0A1E3NX33_WICAA|nr:uncharacterized protein WICANDRAFT_85836 [Wickerhamomyces anomalus NRRL Y-366-8]ODQ57741.1 hypothetical protein WICANDRAFT_85836 [Wickerhamomyces anomalus NRRL Y-366-8]